MAGAVGDGRLQVEDQDVVIQNLKIKGINIVLSFCAPRLLGSRLLLSVAYSNFDMANRPIYQNSNHPC